MIVILKREDLPLRADRRRAVGSLTLDHFGLSKEMINSAEMIVFVEGEYVKFLKSDILQNTNQTEVLIRYIMSREQKRFKVPPINVKDLAPRRPHGNLRRRKDT